VQLLRPVFVFLVLALVGCAKKADLAAGLKPFVPMAAPSWQLKDVDGKVVGSDQFKDKLVVVDFWATWCVPCREEIPGYIELQKKYAKDGVVFLGISMDEQGPEVVKQFIEKFGINYPVVIGDETTTAAYGGVEYLPTTFIIDRAGTVRERKVGPESQRDFEKRLRAYLK
jgi:thiol-disulfide isomerase/thioredoxin